MKSFIVLFAVFVIAKAFPATDVEVTQDTAGGYNYVIKSANFNKEENRDHSGSVTGFYSYIDANNQLITYKYVSGPDGFRIIDGPVPVAPEAPLPVAPVAEVAFQPVPSVSIEYQPQEQLSAPVNSFSSFKPLAVPVQRQVFDYVPQPVQDTPEVEAAKQAHFAAHREHLALLGQI
ncbi:cuticle protein 6 [Aethina tumida]|uniref:cuticle protein 6 n=1 Tax=Aethina tumida TaxID=116153 RepID=UPI00096B4B80|nr:cuticle protein 6 [Aethina tumida]